MVNSINSIRAGRWTAANIVIVAFVYLAVIDEQPVLLEAASNEDNPNHEMVNSLDSTLNYNVSLKCKTRYLLDNCLGQLPPLLQDSELGIPTSKKDVDIVCKGFKTGMKCIDEYAGICLTAEQRNSLENNVIGARYTFKFLCDDPQFQSDYLKYTPCLRGIRKNWDVCAKQFVSLVREELARKNATTSSRLVEVCCARHGFINCILITTRLKCRKEETVFITKIADTLSNSRVYSPHCKSINISLCSHSPNMQHPSSFALLSVSSLLISISSILLLLR